MYCNLVQAKGEFEEYGIGRFNVKKIGRSNVKKIGRLK